MSECVGLKRASNSCQINLDLCVQKKKDRIHSC